MWTIVGTTAARIAATETIMPFLNNSPQLAVQNFCNRLKLAIFPFLFFSCEPYNQLCWKPKRAQWYLFNRSPGSQPANDITPKMQWLLNTIKVCATFEMPRPMIVVSEKSPHIIPLTPFLATTNYVCIEKNRRLYILLHFLSLGSMFNAFSICVSSPFINIMAFSLKSWG